MTRTPTMAVSGKRQAVKCIALLGELPYPKLYYAFIPLSNLHFLGTGLMADVMQDSGRMQTGTCHFVTSC